MDSKFAIHFYFIAECEFLDLIFHKDAIGMQP